jgi:alpha-tubulin suppressor-like RCC1 family protein
VSTAGTVKCWGHNNYGQLGDGTTTDRLTPTSIANLGSVAKISLGFGHTCALMDDGTVLCWGWNADGQLGIGNTVNKNVPTVVPNLADVTGVAAGGRHTCAVRQDGSLWCWGGNHKGAVGDGTNENRLVPTLVPRLKVVEVAAGGNQFGTDVTCAVLEDKSLMCWGANDKGQLGNGSTTDMWSPALVAGLTNVEQAAVGSNLSCALGSDQKVRCWGDDTYGAVGNHTVNDTGTFVTTPTPIVMPLIATVRQITVGSDAFDRSHACLVREVTNTVACWGFGLAGETGASQGPIIAHQPLDTFLVTDAHSVAAGGVHTCALTGSGTKMMCWGSNQYGVLGTGGSPEKTYMAVPVTITWP